MPSFAYPATFRRDENGRAVVSFPEFLACHTDGKDLRETVEEAIDCLGSVIAARIADRSTIPLPSRLKRGQRLLLPGQPLAPATRAVTPHRATHSPARSVTSRFDSPPFRRSCPTL